MENKTFEIQPIFSSFLIQKKLNLDTKSIKNWIEKSSHTDYKIPLTFDEDILKDFYLSLKEILDNLHLSLDFQKIHSNNFKKHG